jgi:hypothetical protein
MAIKKGSLELVRDSLLDLGRNRLSFPVVRKLLAWSKAVDAAIEEKFALQKLILQPYLPEGSEVLTPKDEGFAECAAKLNELYGEAVAFDEGLPVIKYAELPEDVQVTANSLLMLEEAGAVEE